MKPKENGDMVYDALQATVGETTTTDNREVSYDEKTIEDSYFGGRLIFRTKIVWPNAIVFAVLHLAAFYGICLCIGQVYNLQFLSTLYAYFMGFLGGEGITIGAHRLWCHRSYKARRPLRIMLIIGQTLAGQNSCHTWVKDHRQHHKFSDTDGDPHNAGRGFFFAHMGWLMMRRHPVARAKARTIYMSDVERDPVVMFQKKHFKKLFFVIGFLIPVLIPCVLWGESYWNSVFISFFYRYILLLHVTWTVNSLAHFYGNKPYDKEILPTQNIIVSLIGYGEGWHNYHHAFPWDYKASEYGTKLNFTRNAIQYFERVGWAYDLKEASQDMVLKKIKNRGDGTHRFSEKVQLKHKQPSAEEEATGW